jgi:hypothetical protein
MKVTKTQVVAVLTVLVTVAAALGYGDIVQAVCQ